DAPAAVASGRQRVGVRGARLVGHGPGHVRAIEVDSYARSASSRDDVVPVRCVEHGKGRNGEVSASGNGETDLVARLELEQRPTATLGEDALLCAKRSAPDPDLEAYRVGGGGVERRSV